MGSLPERVDVLGTGVSAATLDEVVELVLEPPAPGIVISVSNVHAVMTARKDAQLREALARSEVVCTDGMPLAWALRAMGHPGQERVHGMSLTMEVLRRGRDRGARHFFYGSTDETLAAVERNVPHQVPGVKIAGLYSPPFRPLEPHEEDEIIEQIKLAGTTVLWVGLGLPRQEIFANKVRDRLPGVAIIGIGAVFDWFAGNVTKAPDWMQKAGLEWLYRLAKEPRRLWRRYIWNNPAYLILLGKQILRWRMSNKGDSV